MGVMYDFKVYLKVPNAYLTKEVDIHRQASGQWACTVLFPPSPLHACDQMSVFPHITVRKVIKLKLDSLSSWNMSTSLLDVKSVKLSEIFPVARVERAMRMFVEGWVHLPWPSTPSFHRPFLRKLRGDRSRLVCPGLRSWLLWSGGRRCSQV